MILDRLINEARTFSGSTYVIPAIEENTPQYECKACGTQWVGSKLIPIWAHGGKECRGVMEKITPETKE